MSFKSVSFTVISPYWHYSDVMDDVWLRFTWNGWLFKWMIHCWRTYGDMLIFTSFCLFVEELHHWQSYHTILFLSVFFLFGNCNVCTCTIYEHISINDIVWYMCCLILLTYIIFCVICSLWWRVVSLVILHLLMLYW